MMCTSDLVWHGYERCNAMYAVFRADRSRMGLIMRYGHAAIERAATHLQSKDDVRCHLQRESGRVG